MRIVSYVFWESVQLFLVSWLLGGWELQGDDA